MSMPFSIEFEGCLIRLEHGSLDPAVLAVGVKDGAFDDAELERLARVGFGDLPGHHGEEIYPGLIVQLDREVVHFHTPVGTDERPTLSLILFLNARRHRVAIFS